MTFKAESYNYIKICKPLGNDKNVVVDMRATRYNRVKFDQRLLKILNYFFLWVFILEDKKEAIYISK